MERSETAGSQARVGDNSMSLLQFFTLLLSHRRFVAVLGFGLAGFAAISSFMNKRQWASTAVFVPEESSNPGGDLAATARQFGIGIGGQRNVWTSALYVEVVTSPGLLQQVVSDTFVVAEEGGRKATLIELLEAPGSDSGQRVTNGVRMLRQGVLRVSEERGAGTVTIVAKTRWPSVSYAIVTALIDSVNAFNVGTRQSRAAAELKFAEERSIEAERELRAAEDALERFLETNRLSGQSAQLALIRSRLDRNLGMKSATFASLVQAREDARLRRVRDTPVLTVIRKPLVPSIGEARGTILRTLVGGLFGGILSIGILMLGHSLRRSREAAGQSWIEFTSAAPVWLLRLLKQLDAVS